MKMALLRVGADSGNVGTQGPLFADGSFEFLPIPDKVGVATYGNTVGQKGQPLVHYFSTRRQARWRDRPMHDDPEFRSFTYGDPTPPKRGLRKLSPGDMLVFYAGLQGWDHESAPALYVVGYFLVEWAGLATQLTEPEVRTRFASNFHVANEDVFQRQRERLVLVKGGRGSRLLTRAVCISATGQNRAGKGLKVLSPEAKRVFGDFDGKDSIERSPTRWVHEGHVAGARDWVLSLP
jgi:hypothetical protein